MSVSIKTLDDFGFLLSFVGGILTVVFAVSGVIIAAVGETINWFISGGGVVGSVNEMIGCVIAFIFGVFAILIGLKIFVPKIREIMVKIDLIITAIIILVIGVIVFGIGGLLIIIGGILILVYRLMPEGVANPTGK